MNYPLNFVNLIPYADHICIDHSFDDNGTCKECGESSIKIKLAKLSQVMAQEIFDNIHAKGIARLSIPPSQIGEIEGNSKEDCAGFYLL